MFETRGRNKNTMTQEIVIKGKKAILETDVYYSGDSGITDKEKLIRKALKLPVTKKLVYYRNKHDTSSVVYVSNYKIIEMYNISYPWYTLEIRFRDTEDTVKIHSSFFVDMQDPKFVEKFKKQEGESAEE